MIQTLAQINIWHEVRDGGPRVRFMMMMLMLSIFKDREHHANIYVESEAYLSCLCQDNNACRQKIAPLAATNTRKMMSRHSYFIGDLLKRIRIFNFMWQEQVSHCSGGMC